MRLSETCAVCLYDKQKKLVQDEEYLAEVRELLENRDPEDTSPYMVYLFDRAFVSRFGDQGETGRYRAIKQTFNDLVLSMEDAAYVEIDRLATIVSNGAAIPGTVYKMLSEDARRILDTADVILAKGQGNYESLSSQGRHIFYVFLCKCDLFTWRFQVPRLTGMFVEEKPMDSGV